MEFHKPKMDEVVDEALVHGHEWKIFPLIQRRDLFADVEEFHLFDFFTAGGKVNEDVLAYSNRRGGDRGLVIYHNRYRETRGWIKVSAAALDRGSGRLVQRSLGEALGIPREGYAIFWDVVTHTEYIRSCTELWEKGMYAELGGYQHHAFLNWRFVDGSDWAAVCDALNGTAAESMQSKRDEMFGAKATAAVSEAGEKSRKPGRRKPAARKAPPKKVAAGAERAAAKRRVPAKKGPAKKGNKSAAKKAANGKPKTRPARKSGRGQH
jgi:hypothetical protein